MTKIIATTLAVLLGAAYGSVADIEILLALITSVGLIFSIFNLREAARDYHALRRKGKSDRGRNFDPLMVVAVNGLRSELARGLIQFYFLTLAVFAMFIPETPAYVHLPLRETIFGFIFRWGIIASSGLLTLKSYWGYQVRREVKEHYDQSNVGVPGPPGPKGEAGEPGTQGPQGVQGIQGVQGPERKL